jgi:hypothetical protein
VDGRSGVGVVVGVEVGGVKECSGRSGPTE